MNRFVGTWRVINNNVAITFFSDGTCSPLWGTTYEIKDGKLVFVLYSEGNELYTTFDYLFSEDNATLYITQTYPSIVYTLIKQG